MSVKSKFLEALVILKAVGYTVLIMTFVALVIGAVAILLPILVVGILSICIGYVSYLYITNERDRVKDQDIDVTIN